jgi:hypothetical protein
MKYPSKVNIYNLSSFFNFKPISPGQIYPGNLIQFNYRSPEGVHDKKPLVYVLEVEGDRIWGINLHYKFFLLSNLIQDKIKLVEGVKQATNTSPEPTPGQLNKPHIPNLSEIKKELDSKSIPNNNKISPQLLEQHQLSTIPSDILRNYLYTRISGLQKLIFKVQ